MNPFVNAFNVILYQPLFNALVLVYVYLPGHDFGIAIIILTILIKIILYPLGAKAIRSQKAMAYLQPAQTIPGMPCEVDIRGKVEPAQIVALPFYRRPKNAKS